MMKRMVAGFMAVLTVALAGCGAGSAKKAEEVQVTSTVTKDEKFGSACVAMTPEEFEEAGFVLGDSVDVVFENGYEMKDVPFYNGYYVKNAAPVVVAYPGFDYICITLNNAGIWDTAALTDDCKVEITRNTSGKYSAIQESLGQKYSFERKDYTSDESFCNFRTMTGGALLPDTFYRGASPVDNSRGRAAYTDSLIKAHGVAFIMDLADSMEDMEGYFAAEDFASPYAKQLLEDGMIALLDMGSSYQSEAYQQKVVEGLREMIKTEGPVYIHCMEGKDRTGFVCTLLEAYAGATYEEMLTDYMITYNNYYSVTKEKTPEKYQAIAELYFDSFAACLHGTEDQEVLKSADYTEDAAAYLKAGGMTEEELDLLYTRLTGKN